MSERFGVHLVLQYSAVDLMNCLCMVFVVSLLCPNSWPVMAFRVLSFGVHLILMSAMCSLNVKTVVCSCLCLYD